MKYLILVLAITILSCNDSKTRNKSELAKQSYSYYLVSYNHHSEENQIIGNMGFYTNGELENDTLVKYTCLNSEVKQKRYNTVILGIYKFKNKTEYLTFFNKKKI